MQYALDKLEVADILYAAVDEVNEQLPRSRRLERSLDAVISGEGARLDSLGLVNLVFAIEQQIERRTGVSVTLVDDVAMAWAQSPFHTLATLAELIVEVVEKKRNG